MYAEFDRRQPPPEMLAKLQLGVLKLAEQLAWRYAVPLFDDHTHPGLIGTGFLLHDRVGQQYLITADHVFDEAETRWRDRGSPRQPRMCVYTGVETMQELSGRVMRPKEGSPSARYDVAAMVLAGGAPLWEGKPRDSVLVDSVLQYLREDARESYFLTTGYPESRARVERYPTDRIAARPFGIACPGASNARYDPESFVLLSLDRKRQQTITSAGVTGRFPDPRGMSGSPVWALHFDPDWNPHPFLTGIVIEQAPRERFVVCTRIRAAVELIAMLNSENAADRSAD